MLLLLHWLDLECSGPMKNKELNARASDLLRKIKSPLMNPVVEICVIGLVTAHAVSNIETCLGPKL